MNQADHQQPEHATIINPAYFCPAPLGPLVHQHQPRAEEHREDRHHLGFEDQMIEEPDAAIEPLEAAAAERIAAYAAAGQPKPTIFIARMPRARSRGARQRQRTAPPPTPAQWPWALKTAACSSAASAVVGSVSSNAASMWCCANKDFSIFLIEPRRWRRWRGFSFRGDASP